MTSHKPLDPNPTGYAWGPSGHANYVIYAPGERCEALPGCPIYPDVFCTVWWYPGKVDRPRLAVSLKDALEDVKRGAPRMLSREAEIEVTA